MPGYHQNPLAQQETLTAPKDAQVSQQLLTLGGSPTNTESRTCAIAHGLKSATQAANRPGRETATPVLPFRQRVGPWLRQSSLSRGANRLCSILVSRVLQNGPRAGATRAFASVEKLRELLNRHRSQHEKPVSKRTTERYLAEAIAGGFISRESSNRRRARRAKALRGAWLCLHVPEHDLAQPTESKPLAGKNGGNEPYGGFEPSEMAETSHKMAETVPRTLRDQDLREEEKGERSGEGVAKLPEAGELAPSQNGNLMKTAEERESATWVSVARQVEPPAIYTPPPPFTPAELEDPLPPKRHRPPARAEARPQAEERRSPTPAERKALYKEQSQRALENLRALKGRRVG